MLRWPVGRVAVAGTSMAPALLPGDFLLVRYGARPRPGGVVVARRPDRPGLLVVKRVSGAVGPDAWWLAGDDPSCSDDSRVFGPVRTADVLARVVARYWPPGRLGPVPPPRRVA